MLSSRLNLIGAGVPYVFACAPFNETVPIILQIEVSSCYLYLLAKIIQLIYIPLDNSQIAKISYLIYFAGTQLFQREALHLLWKVLVCLSPKWKS